MPLARRHHPNPIREQWDRTERWHARFRAAVAAKEGHVDDFALVVLFHCWSMHDWLTKGLHGTTPRSASENLYTQAEVERLFQSPELRAARTLTNGSKHLDVRSAGFYDGLILAEWDGHGARLVALAHGKFDIFRALRRVRETGWGFHPRRSVGAPLPRRKRVNDKDYDAMVETLAVEKRMRGFSSDAALPEPVQRSASAWNTAHRSFWAMLNECSEAKLFDAHEREAVDRAARTLTATAEALVTQWREGARGDAHERAMSCSVDRATADLLARTSTLKIVLTARARRRKEAAEKKAKKKMKKA